jgi:hypothetical protein
MKGPIQINLNQFGRHSRAICFKHQLLNLGLARKKNASTASKELRTFNVCNMGEKMARSTNEAAMMISKDHAAPSAAISCTKSSICIYLDPSRLRAEPVLY